MQKFLVKGSKLVTSYHGSKDQNEKSVIVKKDTVTKWIRIAKSLKYSESDNKKHTFFEIRFCDDDYFFCMSPAGGLNSYNNC